MTKRKITVNLEEEDLKRLSQLSERKRLSRASLARSLIVKGLEDFSLGDD